MTYCVGLLLNQGMVLLSDTRTNAGLDNIATYRKMFIFEEPGERVIAIMTAGSLSVTPDRHRAAARGDRGPRRDARDLDHAGADHAEGRRDRRQDAGAGARTRSTTSWRRCARTRHRLDDRRRPAQGRRDAAVPDLPRGQFHRGDRGHALPADRRAQIRQADPRPGGAARRPRWPMRRRRCCCRWIRRCARTCRSACRWIWR